MSKIDNIKKRAKKLSRRSRGFCDFSRLMNDPQFSATQEVLRGIKGQKTKEKLTVDTLKKAKQEIINDKKISKKLKNLIKEKEALGHTNDSFVTKNQNPEFSDTNLSEIDSFFDILTDYDGTITTKQIDNFKNMIGSKDFKSYDFIDVVRARERAGNNVSDELLSKTIKLSNEGHNHFSSPLTLERMLKKLGRGTPVNMAIVAGQSGIMKYFALKNLRMTNNKRADIHNEKTNLSTMEQKEQTRRDLSYKFMSKVDDIFAKMAKDRNHKNFGKRLFFGTNDKIKNDFYENEVNGVFDRLTEYHNRLRKEHLAKARELAKDDKFDEIDQHFSFDDVDFSGLDSYAIEIVKEMYDIYNTINELDFQNEVVGSIHPKMLQFTSPRPRIFKAELLNEFLSGADNRLNTPKELGGLIKKAIDSFQPDLKNVPAGKLTLLDLIAEGYVKGLQNKAYGVDGLDGSIKSALETGNLDKFVAEIESESYRFSDGSTSKALREAYESYKKRVEKDDKARTSQRYTRRMILDETVQHTMENGEVISIRDFIENNTEMLLKTEIERGSGRIAAAMNGITDIDTHFKELMEMIDVENRISGNTISPNDIQIYKDIIQNFQKELNGQSFFDNKTGTQQALRFMRNWQIATSMGRLFLSQMFEFSKAISYSSMGDVLKNVPAVLDFRDAALMFREEKFRDSITDKLAQHIIDDLSMGHLQKQQLTILGFDPDYANGQYRKDGSEQNNANKIMDKIVHWSMKFNSQFDSKLRLVAAMSQASQLDRFAKADKAGREKFRKGMYSDKRLNLENFEYNDIIEIADLMNKHGIRESNGKFGGFKFNQFTEADERVFKKYKDYIQKMSKRIVVDKDYSNLPIAQTNPLYKTIMQFRDHGIASLTEELNYNVRSGNDAVSRKFFAYGLSMGALIYTAQVVLSSIGRQDKEEFLEENLAIDKIMLGGFYRMGFAHPPSAALDTVVNWGLGRDAIFNFRLSGHATDIFEGTPIVASLQGGMYLAQMATGADLNRSQTQQAINVIIPNHLLLGESRKALNNYIHNRKEENNDE